MLVKIRYRRKQIRSGFSSPTNTFRIQSGKSDAITFILAQRSYIKWKKMYREGKKIDIYKML